MFILLSDMNHVTEQGENARRPPAGDVRAHTKTCETVLAIYSKAPFFRVET